ncbi:tetratricopeptide repeat protein 9C-like [Physella acuta]|uniref:tetratricopeptide repeat protein 9C-like n=1 Tax=Physella acuta TaxID=109671 RepID=UPI0027DE9146|nr:tetratricopeptide repeat protein 9C-like [Physella acuta]
MNFEGKMSDSDKLSKAREFKEKGNAAHKEGNFKQAAGNYHRAILYLKGLSINCPDVMAGLTGVPSEEIPKMTANMGEDARLLTCDCYNNLAACMLKDPEPKYRRIIEHCDKALEVSPNNTKALYRKGTSLYALGDFEEALSTFEKAQPDANIKKFIDLCKKGIKKQDKEMAEKFKGMFQSR